MANIFGTGADGNLTVSGTTTVTMRQIYENDNVTGITTYRGAGKGLNKGNGTYMATADAMPNFVNVTIDSGQKIIGDTSNRYADAGHTFFKCSGILSGAGSIDESGCGGAGGAGYVGSGGYPGLGGYGVDGILKGGDGGNGYVTSGSAGTGNSGGGGGGAARYSAGSGGGAGSTGGSGAGGGGGGYHATGGNQAPGGAGAGAGYGTAANYLGAGANGVAEIIAGRGGGGNTYGSANFGNNDYKLAGSEFYIGSGGGGAGASDYPDNNGGNGGDGGGKIKIFAKEISNTVGIYANGNSGSAGSGTYFMSGGSGSGGSIWILSKKATLGSGKVTATGQLGTACGAGTGWTSGASGDGRIRIDGNYTGTTTPTVGYAGELKFTTPTKLLLMLN